jgi:hypothetical protein
MWFSTAKSTIWRVDALCACDSFEPKTLALNRCPELSALATSEESENVRHEKPPAKVSPHSAHCPINQPKRASGRPVGRWPPLRYDANQVQRRTDPKLMVQLRQGDWNGKRSLKAGGRRAVVQRRM